MVVFNHYAPNSARTVNMDKPTPRARFGVDEFHVKIKSPPRKPLVDKKQSTKQNNSSPKKESKVPNKGPSTP